MRLILVVLCLCYLSFAGAEEPEKKLENLCEKAVNQETDFQVTGIYGSPIEAEWHPAAAYVLRKEMQRFEVLQREFQKKTAGWRYEFAEMVGGKTVVFVYHRKQLSAFLSGPNGVFLFW